MEVVNTFIAVCKLYFLFSSPNTKPNIATADMSILRLSKLNTAADTAQRNRRKYVFLEQEDLECTLPFYQIQPKNGYNVVASTKCRNCVHCKTLYNIVPVP